MSETGQGAGVGSDSPGNSTQGMKSSIRPFLSGGKADDDGHESLGNKLFIGAWSIEIVAASVGLFMALVQIIDATQRQASDSISTTLNAVLAALPFFAVVIVELTKIPLATVFYKTTVLRWKVIFISGLLLTMGITFETFFLGFERYFSLLSLEIYELQLEIGSTKAKLIGTEAKKTNALKIIGSREADVANHKKNVATNKKQYDDDVEALNQQKLSTFEKYAGNLGPLKEEIKAADQHIKQHRIDLNAELKNIESDYKRQISGLTKDHSKNIANIQVLIKNLEGQLDKISQGYVEKRRNIEKNFKENYAECFLSCVSITENRDKGIADLNLTEREEKENLNRQLNDLRTKAALSSSDAASGLIAKRDTRIRTHRQSVGEHVAGKEATLNKKRALLAQKSGIKDPQAVAELENIQQKLISAGERLNERQKQENQRYEALEKGFSSNQKSIQDSEANRGKLEESLRPKCTELNKRVISNQIYRLTKTWTGKDDACDITQDDLKFTQIVWFGSLALIVSGLGTLLAFGGLVIKFPPQPLNKGRPIKDRVRMLLVAIRRRLNAPKIVKVVVEKIIEKTVEVTKEVPVDKVVFKEVPVEVTKKELIHVPVYTEDPELLGHPYKDSKA